MRVVTFKAPEEMLVAIDEACRMCGYSSRSEFIREAIRRMLEQVLGHEDFTGIMSKPVEERDMLVKSIRVR